MKVKLQEVSEALEGTSVEIDYYDTHASGNTDNI